MRAVRFDEYGDVDVLYIADVPDPQPGPGQAVVDVRAAGINPGEATIRKGLLHDRWPATFPSGQGSDFAGVVSAVGEGVSEVAVGDEVIGFVHTRSSHAERVVADASDLVPRPPSVAWEQAGALFVAGTTAYAAIRAVGASAGDVVAISGAAGGVGCIAVQLAVHAGAEVIGLAGEHHHERLAAQGATPVTYGDGVAERIRASASGDVTAFVDTFGDGYVDLAIALGVAPGRIDTIIDYDAAARTGAKTDGNAAGASAEVLGELAGLMDDRALEIPIAATYPLEQVRDAYREVERRHTLGKIVLVP